MANVKDHGVSVKDRYGNATRQAKLAAASADATRPLHPDEARILSVFKRRAREDYRAFTSAKPDTSPKPR